MRSLDGIGSSPENNIVPPLLESVPLVTLPQIPSSIEEIQSMTREEFGELAKQVMTLVQKPQGLDFSKEKIEELLKTLDVTRARLIEDAQPKKRLADGTVVFDNQANPDGVMIGKARDIATIMRSLSSLIVKS